MPESPKKKIIRPQFRRWIDEQDAPAWSGLPLTHMAPGLSAEDIANAAQIEPSDCAVFGSPLSYFFYGRPAYRISNDSTIKLELACPFCLVFDPSVISQASGIYAFDTGAFAARMYKHVLSDPVQVDDFSLEADAGRADKLVERVFGSRSAYLKGDPSAISDLQREVPAHEMLVQAYLHLLSSPGRNEPDDRLRTVEVQFSNVVPLANNLIAIVVPHTMWSKGPEAPWLLDLANQGVSIIPYEFIPGFPPEKYQAQIDVQLLSFYESRGYL